jgi:hypothetical protein
MPGDETQMMRRIHHVSGQPEGGVLTCATDAHSAVGRFPDEWSFTPWSGSEPTEKPKSKVVGAAVPSSQRMANHSAVRWRNVCCCSRNGGMINRL